MLCAIIIAVDMAKISCESREQNVGSARAVAVSYCLSWKPVSPDRDHRCGFVR